MLLAELEQLAARHRAVLLLHEPRVLAHCRQRVRIRMRQKLLELVMHVAHACGVLDGRGLLILLLQVVPLTAQADAVPVLQAPPRVHRHKLLHHRYPRLLGDASTLADPSVSLELVGLVAVGLHRLRELLLGALAEQALATLLQLPPFGAVGQANLQADLVPHTQWLGGMALLAAPPVQDTRHAWRSEVLHVRERRETAVQAGRGCLHQQRLHQQRHADGVHAADAARQTTSSLGAVTKFALGLLKLETLQSLKRDARGRKWG